MYAAFNLFIVSFWKLSDFRTWPDSVYGAEYLDKITPQAVYKQGQQSCVSCFKNEKKLTST